MELLTIGAFARAARLSAKALRLYDERGILRPARVDPDSGYRFYRRDQLERARLVAWLRRLGMPLSRIATVCALEPRAAADEVAAYWREVLTEVAARGDIATLLIDHLSRKDESMTDTRTVTVRGAALCDPGKVRASNQDAAYCGEYLLAVADGFGADSGTPVSEVAIDALRAFDTAMPEGELLGVLEDAAAEVESAVRSAAGRSSGDPGTTLTALLWSGSRVGLLHVGDSRGYLMREGRLSQATDDHTIVQSLVDEGKLAPEEAPEHPDRSTLFKAFTGHAESSADPQLRVWEVVDGDRYLLCSDGLHTVVDGAVIGERLVRATDPEAATRELVELATAAGGPDNIACVVADIVLR